MLIKVNATISVPGDSHQNVGIHLIDLTSKQDIFVLINRKNNMMHLEFVWKSNLVFPKKKSNFFGGVKTKLPLKSRWSPAVLSMMKWFEGFGKYFTLRRALNSLLH